MRRLAQRPRVLQLVPHPRHDPGARRRPRPDRRDRRLRGRRSTTTPRSGSTARCRSRSATPAARSSAASTRPTASCSRATRGRATASRSPSSASTARSPPRRTTTSGCAPRRSTSTPRERAACGRPAAVRARAPRARPRRRRAGDGARSSRSPAASSSPRARCGARDGALLFSSPNTNAIYRWDPRGEVTVFRSKSGYTGTDIGRYHQPGSNGLTFDPDGRLTMCQHGNRRVIRVEPHGNVTVLADRYEGRRLNTPNDLVYRSDGTLFFTDPPFGLPGVFDDPAKELPFSAASSRVRDGEVILVDRRARRPQRPRLLARRALPLRRQLGPRSARSSCATRSTRQCAVREATVFADMTDAPGEDAIDGLKVDEAGNVYACGPGGVWIISPDGRAPRPAAAARGPAQPRLGRRRRPHALHHRADERLPDPPGRPGRPHCQRSNP